MAELCLQRVSRHVFDGGDLACNCLFKSIAVHAEASTVIELYHPVASSQWRVLPSALVFSEKANRSPALTAVRVCAQGSPLVVDLITRMLTADPAKRCTVSEMLQHPWVPADLPPGTAELNKQLLQQASLR